VVKLRGRYEFLEGLYYSKDHLWARVEDGRVRVGITDFAQKTGGTILYVRSAPLGTEVKPGDPLGTMETGKWVGLLKSPVSGSIAEFNQDLEEVEKAKIINEDPYGKGWIFVLQPTSLREDLKQLMTDPKVIEPWLEEEVKRLEIVEEEIT